MPQVWIVGEPQDILALFKNGDVTGANGHGGSAGAAARSPRQSYMFAGYGSSDGDAASSQRQSPRTRWRSRPRGRSESGSTNEVGEQAAQAPKAPQAQPAGQDEPTNKLTLTQLILDPLQRGSSSDEGGGSDGRARSGREGPAAQHRAVRVGEQAAQAPRAPQTQPAGQKPTTLTLTQLTFDPIQRGARSDEGRQRNAERDSDEGRGRARSGRGGPAAQHRAASVPLHWPRGSTFPSLGLDARYGERQRQEVEQEHVGGGQDCPGDRGPCEATKPPPTLGSVSHPICRAGGEGENHLGHLEAKPSSPLVQAKGPASEGQQGEEQEKTECSHPPSSDGEDGHSVQVPDGEVRLQVRTLVQQHPQRVMEAMLSFHEGQLQVRESLHILPRNEVAEPEGTDIELAVLAEQQQPVGTVKPRVEARAGGEGGNRGTCGKVVEPSRRSGASGGGGDAHSPPGKGRTAKSCTPQNVTTTRGTTSCEGSNSQGDTQGRGLLKTLAANGLQASPQGGWSTAEPHKCMWADIASEGEANTSSDESSDGGLGELDCEQLKQLIRNLGGEPHVPWPWQEGKPQPRRELKAKKGGGLEVVEAAKSKKSKGGKGQKRVR